MEKTLGLEFPREYKEFLKTFGSFGDILGKETASDSVVKATLSFREGYPGPPKNPMNFQSSPITW